MSAPKKGVKPNAITDITLKSTANLKTAAPALFQEFVKIAEKYQKTSEALATLGVSLSEQIAKIGASAVASADYADGITKAANFLKESEAKRDELARAMIADMVAPLRQSIDTEQRDALSFEKNYKKDKESSRQEIMKLESRTKKAGKKTTPEVLKQQISELNDKIKEAENISANRMKEVVLLERKRYATFLDMLTKVLRKTSDIDEDFTTKYKALDPSWTALIAASSQLPKEIEDMVNKQERTFVQIQGGSEGDNDYRLSYAPGALPTGGSYSNLSSSYESYDSYSSYDSYDSGYAAGGGGGGGGYDAGYGASSGGAQARALYDYASDEPADLPLGAGEIITILQDDDGSGWTKGQNSEGRSGIFPTSYIEYM